MNKKIALSLATVAILSGCSTTHKPIDVEDTNYSEALNELVNISVEARDELRILAKSREAVAQESMTKEQHEQRYLQATYVPDGFKKAVSFKFTGPSSEAAEAIAKMAGYKFKRYGKPLAVTQEPWVNIQLKNQPLNDGLKELGLQTGDSVRIEVHPPAKLLRYVYKSAQ
ncbi:DotD/TraH family lipoprotein [Vibrio owensii]|uniref:DotD/TraH family lipoprotein n=1 Tax=Vibrio harveyi group TaxID=717610 RepID=UPI003CC5A9C2